MPPLTPSLFFTDAMDAKLFITRLDTPSSPKNMPLCYGTGKATSVNTKEYLHFWSCFKMSLRLRIISLQNRILHRAWPCNQAGVLKWEMSFRAWPEAVPLLSFIVSPKQHSPYHNECQYLWCSLPFIHDTAVDKVT